MITTELSFSFFFIYIFLVVLVLKSCFSADDINLLWDVRYMNSFLGRQCLCYWRMCDTPWHDISYLSSALCWNRWKYQSALPIPKMAGKTILLLFEEIIFNPVTYCLYWKIPQLPIILSLLSLKFLITDCSYHPQCFLAQTST